LIPTWNCISITAAELGIDSLTLRCADNLFNSAIENTLLPHPSEIIKQAIIANKKRRHWALKWSVIAWTWGVNTVITLEQLKKVLIEESGVDKTTS